MNGRGSMQKDWLHATGGKPPGQPSQENLILNLWILGCTEREIAERVKHRSGAPYRQRSIGDVVRKARQAGDLRAQRRRPLGLRQLASRQK